MSRTEWSKDKLTKNTSDMVSILSTLVAYSGLYGILYSIPQTKPKARVYVSLTNALILSALSYRTFATIQAHGTNTTLALLMQPEDVWLANYTIGYFSADLLLGALFDRKHMSIVAGYVHHSVYIALVHYLKSIGHSNLIYICAPFEIPTLLLDINRIKSTPYGQAAFGLTFAAFRIVYNIYMLSTVYKANPNYNIITTLMLTLHTIWIRDWYTKFILS
jgi:hypothetical protein